MKKNFYYLSLLLGLVLGMTMFTACGGDDDNGGGASGGASGGGAGGFTPGKFMGPKRVFGDNLLSSYGNNNKGYELTYNSDDFVTSIKPYSIDANNQKQYSGNDYEVTYSDKQVIVTRHISGGKQQTYTYTIGNNGFVESYVDVADGNDEVKMEYDSEGHITKITSTPKNEPHIWNGTLTWQNGNVIKTYDSDTGSYTQNYTSINNVAGIYVRAAIGGDLDDYYDEMLYYMGLLGKGTANLVSSSSRSEGSSTYENSWTLDDAGRPTKCVTTKTGSGSGTPTTSTYFWTYR